ncbi:MAG: hypothetical protein IJW32_03115 [Clostridia bacterium]|nr:hypothetical protein [Clostridia bacterium]
MFQFIRKKLKENYEFILCLTLLFIILVIAINPSPYISSTLKGITVWAKIVLPSLFLFFILTKILMQFKSFIKVFNFLNKPFEKIFNTKKVGGYTFFMSAISGYPIGAKLVSEFYLNNQIDKNEAFRMSTYCSTSGPMFILGSVAVSMFANYNLGIVIMLSHFISALINGLLYRNFKFKDTQPNSCSISSNKNKPNEKITIIKKESLNDIVYNSIISLFMVGGYIALCFTLLEILFNISFLKLFINLFNNILPTNLLVGEGIIKGIVEITNGCVFLSTKTVSIKALAIILSGLISFGGFSIHLQSQMFLSRCNIKYKYFLLSKITHSIIAIILSTIFSIIIL